MLFMVDKQKLIPDYIMFLHQSLYSSGQIEKEDAEENENDENIQFIKIF